MNLLGANRRISPETYQQIQKDVCEEAAADVAKALDASLEEGWLVWGIAKPKQRLQGYEAVTLPEDRMYVLTEDYVTLRKAGALPELQCVLMWQQAMQPHVDPMTGMSTPATPPQDMRPFFWALLLLLPDRVFEHFASDFRTLAKAEAEKVAAA